jgi:PPOX class probable F420-dependent enzyme
MRARVPDQWALRESFFSANDMSKTLPAEFQEQKYLSLITFRKNGTAVPTPVWFAEADDKFYVMTRSDSGKYKRIRNNLEVRIAPCNIRGKITGPEFPASARILPVEEWDPARRAVRAKYWITRITALWSKKNVYLEITL